MAQAPDEAQHDEPEDGKADGFVKRDVPAALRSVRECPHVPSEAEPA